MPGLQLYSHRHACDLQVARVAVQVPPALSAALLCLSALVGCVRDARITPAVETVAALQADVQRVAAGVGDIASRIARVDQSVNNYDRWTLRLQAIAPWLLLAVPLPYVLGKLVWLLSERVRYATRRRALRRK